MQLKDWWMNGQLVGGLVEPEKSSLVRLNVLGKGTLGLTRLSGEGLALRD